MRLAGNSEPVKRAGADLTLLVDLEQGRAMTGAVRDQRPVYVDLLPPCNAGCPAGENIQAWLAHAKAGRHEQAWRQLVADNPMPAIHGRVCYHPCERAGLLTANLGQLRHLALRAAPPAAVLGGVACSSTHRLTLTCSWWAAAVTAPSPRR